ncbi:uncharacterized protein I303_107196 [Kwoniella dejecticola CBS 10117]|uniref:UDENN domain-containing protein n=1 Tax=Kwoniella dejecticola CBS 10117 TaxID=1296121 RepID=A0A1A5ZZ01_9TREE|nr:uncharacterized protein I303_06597 [Kwoniella dejecticola CBS 10117]OBR83038.1 hypothetical protein I303_06597 [Kwoniella dejecticola CBS 10117]
MSSLPLNDEDSGDISLSSSHFRTTSARPSSRPSSSGSVSSTTSHTSETPSTRPRSHSRERDVSVPAPAPQRLFGKSLFSRSPQPPSLPEEGPSVRPSSASSSSVRTVSLNDEPILESPQAGPSTITSSSSTSSGNSRPSTTRRQSSGLGRSRSLNVKLPSLDTQVNRSASPMSATSRNMTTPTNKLGWSRRPGEPRPPPLVSESVSKRMSRWVKEVVVCNFDLERGPVVERRAGDRRWGPGEKENVAFSSFPDTSLFAEGSILFSFKIRHIPPDPLSLHHPEPPSPMPDRVVKTVEEEMSDLKVGDPPGEAGVLPGGSGNGIDTPGLSESSGGGPKMKAGDKAEEYRRWDERGREWLYGFVWFEQRRDKGITRGYMQKSLVILTHLPFPTLFSAVLQKVAPTFFEFGYSALEAACHSIASWPDPTPDSILELPMLTDLINVKLPDTTESPQIGKAFGISTPSLQQPILAALPTSTPLRAFASFLPSLWSLWECLILAEPVLIIAPDPKTCSEIVWWLRDLLRPIPPAGDFRPYLHIHDHDFSLLVNSNKPQAGVIVGVTNPFFRNAASHWPNVISIPSQRTRRVVQNGTSPAVASASPSMKDQPEGFLSRRHRGIQKDRVLLKRLEGLVAEGKLDDPEGNEALRTYFQQLTERFLVPLNRYFQTLVPTLSSTPSGSATSVSPIPSPSGSSSSISSAAHTAGAIRPFSLPNFLTHLRNHGPNPLLFKTKGLSTKSRVESDFYASFCMSSTFARWLEVRVNSLGLVLNSNNHNYGGNLTVPGPIPGRGLTPGTPQRKVGDANEGRPGMPRSVSASVGLGILGGPSSEGRHSPVPLNRDSEGEEEEELSSEFDRSSTGASARDSMESGGHNNWNAIQGRPQREREGSGQTIVPDRQYDHSVFDDKRKESTGGGGGWFDTGRRVSEGMVQYRGSVSK